MLEKILSTKWLKPLVQQLLKLRKRRNDELEQITQNFGDPIELARYYIVPDCQHHNPADYDDGTRSHLNTPIFQVVDNFFSEKTALAKPDGRNQMFVLSDAGMGKTSLLMMLKLTQLTAFWGKDYDCVLLKLGVDSLDKIKTLEQRKTVLLLDALDEDPRALGRIKPRLAELLTATCFFHRVIISCRTQFFPKTGLDPFNNNGFVMVEL